MLPILDIRTGGSIYQLLGFISMCNCLQLPESIADISSSWVNSAIEFKGSEIFHIFFQEMESEEFQPDLDYSEVNYKCLECGQYWYIECSPEENPSPLFAIKRSGSNKELSKDEIESSKEYITILAHNGFESTACSMAGCNNYKLKGKALCQKHLTVP